MDYVRLFEANFSDSLFLLDFYEKPDEDGVSIRVSATRDCLRVQGPESARKKIDAIVHTYDIHVNKDK